MWVRNDSKVGRASEKKRGMYIGRRREKKKIES